MRRRHTFQQCGVEARLFLDNEKNSVLNVTVVKKYETLQFERFASSLNFKLAL